EQARPALQVGPLAARARRLARRRHGARQEVVDSVAVGTVELVDGHARMIAIGFRVRSGRAIAVLLEGGASPAVLDVRVVALSDPEVAGTVQPYHAALGEAERLVALVRTASMRSVASLLREHAEAGREPKAAALVVGSLVDPATIANDHMRAHALEGALFRTVLLDALRSHGIEAEVILEKDVVPAV